MISSEAYFVDTNVWLYRLFDDQRIEATERQRKRDITIPIIDAAGVIISTQVVNEISVNLLKKAAFNEGQITTAIETLYNRCTVVEFNLAILKSASDLRSRYNFSYWDSLIIASALSAGASIVYSEDMQDGLVVADRLEIVNPFK